LECLLLVGSPLSLVLLAAQRTFNVPHLLRVVLRVLLDALLLHVLLPSHLLTPVSTVVALNFFLLLLGTYQRHLIIGD